MEKNELGKPEQRVEVLEPSVVREILFVEDDHSGLKTKPFDSILVEHQIRSGRGIDDPVQMVLMHDNFGEKELGIRETTKQQYSITIDKKQIVTEEKKPSVKNIWISWANKFCKLLTIDEARETQYGGKSALEWATTDGGKVPEMVIRASNGYFYPATSKDEVVTANKNARW